MEFLWMGIGMRGPGTILALAPSQMEARLLGQRLTERAPILYTPSIRPPTLRHWHEIAVFGPCPNLSGRLTIGVRSGRRLVTLACWKLSLLGSSWSIRLKAAQSGNPCWKVHRSTRRSRPRSMNSSPPPRAASTRAVPGLILQIPGSWVICGFCTSSRSPSGIRS